MAVNLTNSNDIVVSQTGSDIRLNFKSTNITNNTIYPYNSEIKIGTWVNSKPLYRKTKVFSSSDTTFNYGGEKLLNMGISNVDEIINYKAFYKRSDGSFQQVPNCHGTMAYWGSSIYDINTNGNFIFWVGTLGNSFTINYLVVTFEYTKTTD